MLSPQLLPAQQAFIDGYGLQLVHDPGTHLHHPVAMPQQLPQIAILPARHPDLGKVILQHELQNMLRILPIGLLFAPAFTPDLGRISHPQLELQLRQQSFEPACVSAGFHPHTHLLTGSRQATVELLRSFSVSQSLLAQFSAFCIDKSNLLKARMVITPYNEHVGSFLRAGWLACTINLTRTWEPTLSWNQLHKLALFVRSFQVNLWFECRNPATHALLGRGVSLGGL